MGGEEEIAGVVPLQTAFEVVAARRLEAVGHTRIEVGLAVAVCIDKTRDLIAAEHMHDVIGHDQAERGVES